MEKLFNEGKPYQISDAVKSGKLRGASVMDRFYFHCPSCKDSQIMRVLDYGVDVLQPEIPFPELKPRAAKGFVLAFKLHCLNCGLIEFTKIGNIRWLKGTHSEALKNAGYSDDPLLNNDVSFAEILGCRK